MLIFPFKLVRDKLPEIIKQKGGECVITRLQGPAYRRALQNKLVEEAKEVRSAITREQIIEELADLHEVLATLELSNAVSMNEIEEVQRKKYKERGGFTKGIKLLFAIGK